MKPRSLILTVMTLLALSAMSVCPAEAQLYGGFGGFNPSAGYGGYWWNGPGIGYGPGGFYSGSYASGAYPFNNWYVSPYRTISPGYVGGGGFGYTRNFGTAGYATGWGLPVYSPIILDEQPAAEVSPELANAILSQRLAADAAAANGSAASYTDRPSGNIKLTLPKSSQVSLSYSLNGYSYVMQPGFSQTFRNDRTWVLEFTPRAGATAARYTLKTGDYKLAMGSSGWELRQIVTDSASGIPPAPIPTETTPTPPLPALSTSVGPLPTPDPPP